MAQNMGMPLRDTRFHRSCSAEEARKGHKGWVVAAARDRGVMSLLVFACGEGSAFQCQEESWQVIPSPLKQTFLHNI